MLYRGLVVFALLCLGACAVQAPPEAVNPVSSSIALSADQSMLVIASSDHGLLVVDRSSLSLVHEIPLGARPGHVIVDDGDRAVVTDRGSGEVFVVDIRSGQIEQRIPVGVDPVGLDWVDADTVAVALAGDEAVALVDLAQGSVLSRHKIIGYNASSIAVVDEGRRAVIGHVTGGKLSTIDISGTGEAANLLDLEIPFSTQEVVTAPNLVRTLTRDGDDRLVIAHSHNNNPALRNPDGFSDPEISNSTYGGGPQVPGGILSAVSEVDLDAGHVLVPLNTDGDTMMGLGGGTTIFDRDLVGHIAPPNILNPFEKRMGSGNLPMHNPVAVAVVEQGAGMLILNQGSQNVLFMRRDLQGIEGDLIGFMDVGEGASGLVVSDDGRMAYVWNQFDATITEIAVPSVGFIGGRVDQFEGEDVAFETVTNSGLKRFLSVSTTQPLVDDTLSPMASIGRRLFHDATSKRISANNTISCAGCHPDAMADGQTWGFEIGPRNTPQLTGGISGTEPFHWNGNVRDIFHLNDVTIQQLMGGAEGGLNPSEMSAILTFLDELPRTQSAPAVNPDLAAAQERGRIVFEDEEVACLECHAGPKGTDNQNWDVNTSVSDRERRDFQTPPLMSLMRTAPYMHDGSAATLRDVVDTWVVSNRMGKGSHLDEQQRQDLVTYLESL